MLQRLFALSALLASAAALTEAAKGDATIHVRLHHSKSASHHNARAADAASGSGATETVVAPAKDPNVYAFTPVTSIQARVQGKAPLWDEKTKTWVGSFGATYEEKFRAVLDTVNTASVEGALMYVQAEGINVKEQSVKCERKNKMQYIEFYEITFAQPNASLAYYANKHEPVEYCPYVAMDGGLCSLSGTEVSDACKQFDGIGGQPKLGHCVGAGEQASDKRAPYPDNYWFSFPNSCVTKAWGKEKTDACRSEFGGGLCAPGETPDGVKCTYTYKILGYLNIDDLVGITNGDAADGKEFKNFTEFCNAGNVEFSAENTADGFVVDKSIAFWEKPGDKDANQARTKKMVELYNELAPDAEVGTMTPLPEIAELVKKNPACYLNSVECATAKNGCRRKLYSQLCEVCASPSDDCKVAPSSFTYPKLEVPTVKKEDASAGSGSKAGNSDAGSPDDAKKSAASASLVASAATVAVTVLAAALL